MAAESKPRRHERGMLVGEAANALGVGVQTLHYYERERLIPAPERSASGYRLYPRELVERIGFIKKAQALGFPLGEIKEVLRLADQGTSPCGRVQAALAEKLREVDARLRNLRSFRGELAGLIRRASALQPPGSNAQVCAIVEKAPALSNVTEVRPPLMAHRDKRARTRLPALDHR